MERCNCKVGRCLLCDSMCKRCGCACDGVLPQEALARKRGTVPGKRRLTLQRNSEVPKKSKRTRKFCQTFSTDHGKDLSISNKDNAGNVFSNCALATSQECSADTALLKDVNGLYTAFGWSESTRRNLPSMEQRKSNKELSKTHPNQRSAMSHSALSAAVCVAEILYPANHMSLLEDVALRNIGPGSNGRERQAQAIIDVLGDIIRKSPRCTIQSRVARAVLVKGLSHSTLSALRSEKNLTMGGTARAEAYRDINKMLNGEELRKRVVSLARVDDRDIEQAVKIMLSPSNVGTLSWGTKQYH